MIIGDRVRLSETGIRALNTRKNRERLGTVVDEVRDGIVTIRWDGNKSNTQFAERYLEVVSPAPIK
jgi:hypothetical protein